MDIPILLLPVRKHRHRHVRPGVGDADTDTETIPEPRLPKPTTPITRSSCRRGLKAFPPANPY